MRHCDRNDELSRLRPTKMVIEMWPVVGFLLVLLTCTAAQSQQTVLSPDSVESFASVVFYHQGERGNYGNNVTFRSSYLPDSANKAWYDEEVILPNGMLRKFYLMTHNYGQLDEASTRIRLQIWRPVDMANSRLMLVWQQRVQVVAASAQLPLLYTYKINQTVALKAGDRIGWTFEGKAGPISFEYAESHRTRVQSSSSGSLPEVGQTIVFDPVYVPSIFSVAVYVNDTLPELPGSGSTGTTGALVATGATVQPGYPSPSGPYGTPGTTGAPGVKPATGSVTMSSAGLRRSSLLFTILLTFLIGL